MLDIEILKNLSKLLAKEMSLLEFQQWFTSATWDIDKAPNSRAKELVSTLELALAEHSSGHLPWEELRQELLPLILNPVVVYSQQIADMAVFSFSTGDANSPVRLSYGSHVMALV